MATSTQMASKPDLDERASAIETDFNAKVALKADAATTYSKTEVDAKAASLDADITAIEVDLTAHEAKTSDSVSTAPVHCTPAEKAIWNAKSDASTTYTKGEVDAKLDAKAASADLASGLALKADAATTYSKTEVDETVTAAVKGLCLESTADTKIATAIRSVFSGVVSLKNDDALYAAVKAILEKLGATVEE